MPGFVKLTHILLPFTKKLAPLGYVYSETEDEDEDGFSLYHFKVVEYQDGSLKVRLWLRSLGFLISGFFATIIPPALIDLAIYYFGYLKNTEGAVFAPHLAAIGVYLGAASYLVELLLFRWLTTTYWSSGSDIAKELGYDKKRAVKRRSPIPELKAAGAPKPKQAPAAKSEAAAVPILRPPATNS